MFRTSQKQIEKELGALQTAAADLVKKAQSGEVPHEDGMKAVEGMIKRAENLKRKVRDLTWILRPDAHDSVQLADLHRNAGNSTIEVMRERLQHLAAVETMQLSTGSEFDRWADTRLDRWLTDWALRSGKERTARKLAQSRGIEVCVAVAAVPAASQFLTAARRFGTVCGHTADRGRPRATELYGGPRMVQREQDCSAQAQSECYLHGNLSFSHLLQNPLEYELRLQELIELARAKNSMEAIAYYRKYLMQWQDTHLAQTNQAVTLLAYPPEKAFGPYKVRLCALRLTALLKAI